MVCNFIDYRLYSSSLLKMKVRGFQEVIGNNAPIGTVPKFCHFHKIKKDEIRLPRLVF